MDETSSGRNSIDPSGYGILNKAWKKLRPFVTAIVAVALVVFAPATAGFWYSVLAGAVSGMAGAAANGGDLGDVLKAGILGGISSAAFFGVGEYFKGFGGGGDYFSAANRGLRMTAAAVLGGTASVVSGGKFANGAITAAFSRGFNDEMHHQKQLEMVREKIEGTL
jgi:hypothetical protein